MSTTSQPQKFTGHLFVGKYKLVSEEDVDDYLKALGVNAMKRKLVQVSSQALTCTYDFAYNPVTEIWSVVADFGVLQNVSIFKMGVEREYTTYDGRKVKGIVIMEGEKKMVGIEKWDDGKKSARYSHVIDGDDDLITTMKTGHVKCVQKFRRV